MNSVIAGYNRVGSRTARMLHKESHNVTVVDNNDKKIDRARDERFGTVLGDGGTETVLREASIEGADVIGGPTDDPDIDLTVYMLDKEHDCRMATRINEDYRQEVCECYADNMDRVIYPERLGATGAKTALPGGDFNAIGDLTDQLRLTTVSVPDGAPVVGGHVADIDLGADDRVYAHDRERESVTIPLPGIIVEPDDQLTLLAERNALDWVRSKPLG